MRAEEFFFLKQLDGFYEGYKQIVRLRNQEEGKPVEDYVDPEEFLKYMEKDNKDRMLYEAIFQREPEEEHLSKLKKEWLEAKAQNRK